jgi:hypothetical protein
MNDTLWTTGVVESTQGPVAWPGMTMANARELPKSPSASGVWKDCFQAVDVWIDNIPFIADIIFPPKLVGGTTVILSMDAAYSRERYQKQFPAQEEMHCFEDMFEKYLGSVSHEHTRSWGKIRIAEDPWTHDPSIELLYNK